MYIGDIEIVQSDECDPFDRNVIKKKDAKFKIKKQGCVLCM